MLITLKPNKLKKRAVIFIFLIKSLLYTIMNKIAESLTFYQYKSLIQLYSA